MTVVKSSIPVLSKDFALKSFTKAEVLQTIATRVNHVVGGDSILQDRAPV